MSEVLLEIKGLKANVDGKEILHGVDLTSNRGELHAGHRCPRAGVCGLRRPGAAAATEGLRLYPLLHL